MTNFVLTQHYIIYDVIVFYFNNDTLPTIWLRESAVGTMFSIPVRQILVATLLFVCLLCFIYVITGRTDQSNVDIKRPVHRKYFPHKTDHSKVKKGVRKVKNPKHKDLVTISSKLPTLSSSVIREIKTFTFFIGYPRSGHSIVGSILDAHPHIVLSHELMFFEQWDAYYNEMDTPEQRKANLFNLIYQKSYKNVLPGGERHVNRSQKGYTLAIERSWQGKFDHYIDVIGDKCGGSIMLQYLKDEATVETRYFKLAKDLHTQIKVIHVLRNPYDTIATRLLYQIGKKKSMKSAKFVVEVKNKGGNILLNNTKLYQKRLKEKIRIFFDMVDAIEKFSRLIGKDNVLLVHHKDLVHSPVETIATITSFLGVPSEEKYLQMCADKIYKNVSRSRKLVIWPSDLRRMVESRMHNYEDLKGYTFTSD